VDYAIALTSREGEVNDDFGNFFSPSEGCTPGFRKNHTELWDGVGGDDVTTLYITTSSFNAACGVT